MARLGRYFIAGQPLHVIQRGNDRKPVFFTEEDYAQYGEWLVAASDDNGLSVHAYVFMTNHVHLLVTPQAAESLPKTMQSLGRRYVRHVNARYRRHRDSMGGPLQGRSHRLGGILRHVLPLHRAQSRAGGHGGASAPVSLVELPRTRRGQTGRARPFPRRLPPARAQR